MSAKHPAAIMVGTMARPSSPSVRLTALDAPAITKTAAATKNQPSSISTFLKNGTAIAVLIVGSPARYVNENAAHGGRALLAHQMTLRPVDTDRLPFELLRLEPGDDARSEQEADQQRRHHGAAGAEGEVAEEIERAELIGQREEEMEQHADLSLDA